MLKQIIAVRDIKADAYTRDPFMVIHIGGAIREFHDACRNKENEIGKHPDDYEMHHLGTWDDQTGGFNLFPTPRQIAVGVHFSDQAQEATKTNGMAIHTEILELRRQLEKAQTEVGEARSVAMTFKRQLDLANGENN